MLNNKKFTIVLVLALLIVGAAFYLSKDKQDSEQTQKTQQDDSQPAAIQKTNLDPAQTPDKFPVDMPIETAARITQNYNATAPDGRFQATKEFETTKTLAQNYTIYQNYFKANGWEIKSTINQDTYKMLFGVKGSANLQISMDNNASSAKKTVTISYTELPAPKPR